MKRIITAIIGVIIGQAVVAQRSMDGLVQAEKKFAAYSVANSTKEAFLAFLDSSGLIFENGKPVNGLESWNKREKRPGILNWWPTFAEISKSNDFGYTTGPWTFQQSIKDTVVARGQYTTVWHLDKNGEWKFLVDLGVNNTPVNKDASLIVVNRPKGRGGSLKSLLERERQFILENADSARGGYLKTKNGSTYLNAINGTSILNRNGVGPQVGGWNEEDKPFPEKVHYTILGSGISSLGDLGYVYGTTVINGKTDNYLRIWRREKEDWKIAVEVLRY